MRAALALVGLATMACGEEATPPAPAAAEVSAGNEPITIEVAGRTMRVRCEVSCGPAERELDALRDACVRDPEATAGAVAIDGASLRGLGCCHEAERAYTGACGEDLSRCTSGWLATCEHGALREHASGGSSGVSLTPIDDRTDEERAEAGE